MSQEESNRLIAQFMGATEEQVYSRIEDSKQSGIHMIYPRTSHYPNNCSQHPLGLLKYGSSWDWLIPVVEKIESLDLSEYHYSWDELDKTRNNFEGISVEIDSKTCMIYVNLALDPIYVVSVITSESKIEAVYSAVVEFINYYNNLTTHE